MKKTVLIEFEMDYCIQCKNLCVENKENGSPTDLKYTCGHEKQMNRITNPKEGIPSWCPMEYREIWECVK